MVAPRRIGASAVGETLARPNCRTTAVPHQRTVEKIVVATERSSSASVMDRGVHQAHTYLSSVSTQIEVVFCPILIWPGSLSIAHGLSNVRRNGPVAKSTSSFRLSPGRCVHTYRGPSGAHHRSHTVCMVSDAKRRHQGNPPRREVL